MTSEGVRGCARLLKVTSEGVRGCAAAGGDIRGCEVVDA